MATNIGPKIGIEGEAEYRKQINQIIQETKTLKSAYEAVSSSVDKDTASVKQNKEMKKILTQEIEAQTKKVKELEDMVAKSAEKYGDADPKTLKWKESLNKANTELNEMNKELKDMPSTVQLLGDRMQAAGDKIKSVGDKISGIGGKLSTAITAPIVAIGTAGVRSFAEVDKTMTLTYETMGATEEEAKRLSDAMKTAAANSTFGMSDAAEATLNFARAGLTADQAAAALAPSMNLAAGEGGNLDTVSAGLVATINGFKDSFENTTRYADVFAAACNNSALDIDSLSDSMSTAAPIFSAAGYSVNDAALYMGIMADNGIPASEAATALKTGLARLVSPTKDAAEWLDRLGVNIVNSDGSMKDSTIIQRQLHDAFEGLSESEQLAAGSAIFGKNQMDNWIALVNASPESVWNLRAEINGASLNVDEFANNLANTDTPMDVMMKNMENLGVTQDEFVSYLKTSGGSAEEFSEILLENSDAGTEMEDVIAALGGDLATLQSAINLTKGTTDEMAEAMMSGFGGSLEKLSSSIDVAKTSFGEALAPAVSQVADVVQNLVDAFNSLDDEQKEQIAQVALTVAAVGPALVVIGKVIGGVGSIVSGLGMLMSPVGLAVAAIGGLVVAGVALYENWDTIKEKAGELKDKMSTAWSNMKDDMKRDWDEMKQNASEKWENIKTTISDKVAENGGGIGGVLKTAAEGYAKAWELNFSAMDKLTGGKLSDIKKTVSDKVEGIWKSIKGVGEKISGFHISLPDIKMPHFRISGNFSLKPLRVPSISVDWYAKAMNNGIRLTQPTIFGAAGDRLLGGGEVGNEWVIGENSLMSMIRAAVGSASGRGGNVTVGDTTIVINAADGQDVEEIANRVDEIITGRLEALEAAWA